MEVVVTILISSGVLTILAFAILKSEAKDKAYRAQKGLPPKRYHDITDYEVHDIYLRTNDRRR